MRRSRRRNRPEGAPPLRRWSLLHSRRQGEELKVSSNREYVRRAIQLGFRELHFRDAEAPAFCRDDNRTYFWAVLGKEAVLKPDASATRIESPSVGRTVRVAPTKSLATPSQQSPLPDPIRNRLNMPTPTTNRIQQSTTDTAGAVVGPLLALAALAYFGGNIRPVLWVALVPA